MTNERLFRVHARKRGGRCYELAYNPTGVAGSISGGFPRRDRASIDPVAKQVFADCPDRGTTAAVVKTGPSQQISARIK
jgi:hypothetical protein